ncbi:MAG: penicillin-binding protein 2 [Spirosomataceae bacterium]
MEESRKFIIQVLFTLVGVIYLIRLFYLQVIDDSSQWAAENNAIIKEVQIPPRGQIYDRYGKLIVYNTPVYDLYITPKKVKMADTLAFCKLLDLTRTEFDSLASAAKAYSRIKPSIFMRQLSVEDYAKIQDRMVDFPGFTFERSSFRSYQAQSMANAVGYVAEIDKKTLDNQEEEYYRQGDYIGKSGLEKYYEAELRGQRGVKYIMVNVHGVEKGSYKNGEMDSTAIAGKDLYTSIDLEVQKYCESLFQNKVGSLVAIEPKTGEVLAMVSAPTYDPNLLAGRQYAKNYARLLKDPYKPLINRPLQGYYRPGSTFKTIQALVGLQEGVITPSSVYGHAGAPMKCHGHPGVGGLAGAIQYSCNPYFYFVFRKLIYNNDESNLFKKSAIGLEKWHSYVEKFGIGQKLGVDLPYEVSGNLPDVDYYNKIYKGEYTWKFSNIYSLSIGEGELLISPIKLANLSAIIANKGWYITPHLVKAIGNKNTKPLPKYQEKHYVGIDEHHFDVVLEGMKGAVRAGTVYAHSKVPDIEVAGKTGTSQNKRGDDNAIFICFAPANDPKIAIACFVDNAGFGGNAAAGIATLTLEMYLKRHVDRKAEETSMREKNYMIKVPKPLGAKKDSLKTSKPLPIKKTVIAQTSTLENQKLADNKRLKVKSEVGGQ